MRKWWFCFVVDADTPTPIQPLMAVSTESMGNSMREFLKIAHPHSQIVVVEGPDAATMIQLALHSSDRELVAIVDNMIGAVNTAHLEAQLDAKQQNLAQVA